MKAGWCIDLYRKVRQAEKLLERREEALKKALASLPDEEFAEYASVTERMEV